jgi:hypothetical protein
MAPIFGEPITWRANKKATTSESALTAGKKHIQYVAVTFPPNFMFEAVLRNGVRIQNRLDNRENATGRLSSAWNGVE